jgi:hypothetical protein
MPPSASSARSPLWSKGIPSAANSTLRLPIPTPKMSRPLESASIEASCLASTTGLRSGRMMMPVARRKRRVCAATNAIVAHRSSSCVSGGSGDGAACGSVSTICSPPHRLSKPVASAARATRASASGVVHGCMFIPNTPNFTGGSVRRRCTNQLRSSSRSSRSARPPLLTALTVAFAPITATGFFAAIARAISRTVG